MHSELTPDEIATLDEALQRPPSSLWRDALRHVFHKRSAIVGLVILGILVFVAIFHPLLAPFDPTKSMLDVPEQAAAGVHKRMPPCIHLLGCPKISRSTSWAPTATCGTCSAVSCMVRNGR